jgi:hypothetical protein
MPATLVICVIAVHAGLMIDRYNRRWPETAANIARLDEMANRPVRLTACC